MLEKGFLILVLLLMGGSVSHAQQMQQHGDESPLRKWLVYKSICIHTHIHYIHIEESKSCVSREEFESLEKELNYWQNTTINILKKYLIDNEGMLSLYV